MTTLLLDTHVVLWVAGSEDRIGPLSMAAIADPENDVLVSTASIWEVAIKVALGKLTVPDTLWAEAERHGVTPIPIEPADAVAAGSLPLNHRDPFDRMLIAQAQLRSALLVTADQWATAYDVRVLRADT